MRVKDKDDAIDCYSFLSCVFQPLPPDFMGGMKNLDKAMQAMKMSSKTPSLVHQHCKSGSLEILLFSQIVTK